MNQTSRTFVFAIIAALSAAIAVGVRYANRPASVEGFTDVGQEFFENFKDPLKATSLSVVKYDSESKEPQSFAVNQNDKGLWVIPSHHDYPAEAKDRLAKTAAQLIGLRKVALQSRSKDDWARYGVADPTDESAITSTATDGKSTSSRGTRITLRDSSGNALVDLIVGNPVDGKDKHFYVRQPDKNPVFIAKLDAELSAKFSDWIEPDLLKLNQNDINSLIIDRYSIDEEQGAIVPGEQLTLRKDKPADGSVAKWSLDGLNAETEKVKEQPINDLTRNIDQLKIVGVRPKPEGLNADLTVTPEVAQNPLVRQILEADMQRQGFFVARGPDNLVKLVSNEGEMVAGTSNGVKYTLYFGEVARGSEKDIETGLNEPKADASAEAKADDADTANAVGETAKDESAAPDAPSPPEEPETPESGPRRYLLVKVEFDESLLGPAPTPPVAPEKPAILNDAAPAAEPGAEQPAAAPGDAPAAAPAADAAAPATQPETAPDAPVTNPEPASSESSSEKPPEPGACDEPTVTEPAGETPAVVNSDPSSTPSATDAAPQETTPPETTSNAAATDAAAATEPAAPATSDEAAPPVTPAEPAAAAQPPVDPKAQAQQEYDLAMGEYEAARRGYEDALKSREERKKDGEKKVEELSRRFAAWYYVISADSFEKFKITRADLVEPKEASQPADGAATPGIPGPPGGLGSGQPLPGTP